MKWLVIVATILISTTQEQHANAEEFTKEHKNLLEQLSKTLLSNDTAKNIESPPEKTDPKNDRSETINKGFERMIQAVNILGQIDNFVSSRMRSIIKKLHVMYESDEAEKSKRSRLNF